MCYAPRSQRIGDATRYYGVVPDGVAGSSESGFPLSQGELMSVVSFALPYVLPLFLGSATSLCYQYVKKASAWVDAQPGQIHAFLVGAIAIVLPLVGKVVPGFEATDLAGVDAQAVQSVLALAAAKLTFAIRKK
jgi:hypothetical protein